MSGQWPPEWDDADDGPSDAWLADGSTVTSFLAEVGSPALPAAFEARISAAIAAEAAARASTPQAAASVAQAAASVAADVPVAETGAEDAKDTVRSANPEEFSPVATAGGSATSAGRSPRRASRASRRAAGASRPAHSRPDGRRRRLRMPSAQASGWVALCCLVIAGFGFLITHSSSSSSSSSPYSAAAAPAASAASSAAGASEPHTSTGSAPNNANQETEPSASSSAPANVLFIETGTRYQRSTLASQVGARIIVYGGLDTSGAVNPALSPPPSVAASAPASTAPASSGGVTAQKASQKASPQLEGCVRQLTGGLPPSLVDRASYDGKPAYIIAVPTQAWVVGLGCTAADTDVIAQVPLKG
jgi:trimeric autotransporter adhesin